MSRKQWLGLKILAVTLSIALVVGLGMQTSFSSADNNSIRSPNADTTQRTDVASAQTTSSVTGGTQTAPSSQSDSTTSNQSVSTAPAKPTNVNVNLNAVTPQQSKSVIEKSDRTSNTDAKVVDGAKMTLGTDGLAYYDGRPLLVGVNDQELPSDLDAMMKQGVSTDAKLDVKQAQVQSLPQDKTVVSMADNSLSKALGVLKSLVSPTTAKAAGATVAYLGQVSYGGSIVGDFTLNGVEAFCVQHSLASPSTGIPYDSPNPYSSDSIKRAMFYGWGGPNSIFGNDRSRGVVVTSLVLSRLYNGVSAGGTNIPGYSELWDLANNGSLPNWQVSFTNKNPSVNIKNRLQVSDQTTLNADSSNHVTLWVPNGVTLVNDSTGARVTNGNVDIYGGQTIHLESSLAENYNYSTGSLHGSMKEYQPFMSIARNGSYQTLGYLQYWQDPLNTASFTANFFPRTHKMDVYWMDRFNNNNILKQVHQNLVIGTAFNYPIPPSLTVGGNTYDRAGNQTNFSGTVGSSDVSQTFLYTLRRTVTVNYLDGRTNQPLKPAKVTTVHQNDKYSETHPVLQGYDYLREVGDPESGTIGTSNININYYYSKPLATVKLSKLQIYTAKQSEGLPVKVAVDRVYNYNGIPDLTDSTKKITVGLYQGNSEIDSKSYTASDLPTEVDFKVAPSVLQVNSNRDYTIKLEGFNPIDFAVPSASQTLTTKGYTSYEGGVSINPVSNPTLSTKYTVMTEITPTTPMKSYYETFDITAPHLADKKSGYGVSTNVVIKYSNDLGNDYQLASSVADNSLTFSAPSQLQDSYLDYPVTSGKVNVPMDKADNSGFSGSQFVRTDNFQFPHVNVESMTGKLFTDAEVSSNDSRIRNSMVDGGHKFYSPIWANIQVYNVGFATNQMGVNKVTVNVDDTWNIDAQMIMTMDSKTEKKDEILFTLINPNNPFDYGVPSNWTQADLQWLKY